MHAYGALLGAVVTASVFSAGGVAHAEPKPHQRPVAKAVQPNVAANVANLQASISGESKDLTEYQRWTREATEDGCAAAAELFSKVRRDEAGHLQRFATAARALVDPASQITVPEPPTVTPVAAKAGSAACSGRTLDNLREAMSDEALAAAKYRLFGEFARATGEERLATLFEGTAQVELREHFTAAANLAGQIPGPEDSHRGSRST